MQSKILYAVIALGLVTTGARADVFTLTATVRDFHDSHIDFENGVGTDQGFVDSLLGPDRKPVYVGGEGTLTTHGQEFFDQWYRDTLGVNVSLPIGLPMDNGQEAPGGEYTYCNGSFFPIDDQLFGNEGYFHNYHFTLEIQSVFVYTPNQYFSFAGDDDLFIFINDELVIDLGGVHQTQSDTVDLDFLGLAPGDTYTFALFFAERHTTSSVFCIETNINLQHPCPADFDAGGEVEASDLAALLGAWGPNPGHPADLNTDGMVDAADLPVLLGSWGPCVSGE